MIAKLHFISATILAAGLTAYGQGTLVIDQATEYFPMGFGDMTRSGDSYGQSFIPSLSGVDFITLASADGIPGDGRGATLSLNLRAGSITGPILSSTTPIALPDSFKGSVNSFFPSRVQVNPGTTYFFNIVLQPTAGWFFAFIGPTEPGHPLDAYPNGNAFINGVPAGFDVDLAFQEGIVVPEPASAWLLLVGAAGIVWLRRRDSLGWHAVRDYENPDLLLPAAQQLV